MENKRVIFHSNYFLVQKPRSPFRGFVMDTYLPWYIIGEMDMTFFEGQIGEPFGKEHEGYSSYNITQEKVGQPDP